MYEMNDLVLVVDDSPETLGMLNSALEQAGMTTLVALEGKQALNIARKMTPDIILLDALMPQMDGFETCENLKRDPELQNIPVIFMTGLTDTDNIIKGFEAGGVDYVTKPIKPVELIARIKVHLANARATLSAQTALDTAGHNVCAVNVKGELLWATPQVHQQLEKLTLHHWPNQELARPLANWLNHKPNEGAILRLGGVKAALIWTYIGSTQKDEFLIRLKNDDLPDEVTVLKNEFQLTQREAEVLLWVTKGKTNREAAQILELSPRTINKHLEQVFRKISVDNRTSAAGIAVTCLQKYHR